jgi:malonate transporter
VAAHRQPGASQRAPKDYELFANGPHVATGGYEVGDAALRKEQATSADLGVQWKAGHDRFKVSAFQTRFSNYLALLATGNTRDRPATARRRRHRLRQRHLGAIGLQRVGAARVRLPRRAGPLPGAGGRRVDLRLLQSTSTLDLELRGDLVRADNLTLGQPLPRIAPVRVGATLAWADGPVERAVRRRHLRAPGPRAGRRRGRGRLHLVCPAERLRHVPDEGRSRRPALVRAPGQHHRSPGLQRDVDPDAERARPRAACRDAAGVIFVGMLAFLGLTRSAAVLAITATFSNTVIIGVALVDLAYGPAGLVVLLTLVSLHSLVLITAATLMIELIVAREHAAASAAARHPIAWTVARAVRNSVLHPVPLPIIVGLLFAQTGLALPVAIDKPLMLLGQAFSPVALVLVGITLALTPVGTHLRGALALAAVKNVVHPLLVAGFGWLLGVRGLPLTVMVVAAAMPIGANAFLFSQRYKVVEEQVTAAVVVSTVLALVTLSAAMALAANL